MIIFYPYVYKINKGDFFLLFNNTLLQIYIQRKKITKIAKETAKLKNYKIIITKIIITPAYT